MERSVTCSEFKSELTEIDRTKGSTHKTATEVFSYLLSNVDHIENKSGRDKTKSHIQQLAKKNHIQTYLIEK